MALSKSAMACNVTRSGAMRACTKRTWGVMTPSSVVSARGLECVTVFEEECDLECRIGGVVLGSAGGKRFAVRGHGERIDGKKHEEIIFAPCRHDGPFIEFQAPSDRVSVASRAQGLDPRVD